MTFLPVFSICTQRIMMNHVAQAPDTLCVGQRSVSISALHVVWCQLPSRLPVASKFAYKWTSKRALWHNWLAIRNFLELVTLCRMDQVCTMRNHTHTHTYTREKWLLFCILMRVISCLLAMADKGLIYALALDAWLGESVHFSDQR